jgi:dCTP deaminase
MLDQNKIVIQPFPEDNALQPASLELTLGNRFAMPGGPEDDMAEYEECDPITNKWIGLTRKQFAARTWTDICIAPDEFMLGHTVETVTIPNDVCAQVNGKSSLGRIGLQVHATAGFIDPGFEGQITLELKNMSKQSIWLQPGMRIAQLVFFYTDRPVKRPYGHPDLNSHYQNQVGAVSARGINEYTKEPLPGL